MSNIIIMGVTIDLLIFTNDNKWGLKSHSSFSMDEMISSLLWALRARPGTSCLTNSVFTVVGHKQLKRTPVLEKFSGSWNIHTILPQIENTYLNSVTLKIQLLYRQTLGPISKLITTVVKSDRFANWLS